MKVALYFGSFNPVHIGHMALANYMVEYAGVDQLWFVVSPQNPLKPKSSLLADYHRLEMVNRAIGDHIKFRASNIEFGLPKPSYTVDTLAYLSDKYPQHEFLIIMGADNLVSFHKWKNNEVLLQNYPILVYPRPGVPKTEWESHPNIRVVDAPVMEISASFIRQGIKTGKDLSFFMPKLAYDYMTEMHFYEK